MFLKQLLPHWSIGIPKIQPKKLQSRELSDFPLSARNKPSFQLTTSTSTTPQHKTKMRLLQTSTLSIVEFASNAIPPYAILSHTWEEEEVSFQEMQGSSNSQSSASASASVTTKKGYEKIKKCCEIAAADGFEFAWVDTCCIDKTSSSELSEAINSMWAW